MWLMKEMVRMRKRKMWKCREAHLLAAAMNTEPEHFHISLSAALNFFEVYILAVVFLENLSALLGAIAA